MRNNIDFNEEIQPYMRRDTKFENQSRNTRSVNIDEEIEQYNKRLTRPKNNLINQSPWKRHCYTPKSPPYSSGSDGVRSESVSAHSTSSLLPSTPSNSLNYATNSLDMLPVSVQSQFLRLFQSGSISESDLAESVYRSLNDFTEDIALEIIEKYVESDLSRVRNKTGFFIGILKKYRDRKIGLRNKLKLPHQHNQQFPHTLDNQESLIYKPNSDQESSIYKSNSDQESSIFNYTSSYQDDYTTSNYPIVDVRSIINASKISLPPIESHSLSTIPERISSRSLSAKPGRISSHSPSTVPDRISPYSFSTLPDRISTHLEYDPKFPNFKQPTHATMQPQAMAQSRVHYPDSPRRYSDLDPSRSKFGSNNHFANKDTKHKNIILPRNVQTLFDQTFALGLLSQPQVPLSIYNSLQDFDESTQCSIVQRFLESDLSRVRNRIGYFIGIMKNIREMRNQNTSQKNREKNVFTENSTNESNVPNSHTNNSTTKTELRGIYPSYEKSEDFKKLAFYCQQKLINMINDENVLLKDGDLDHSVFKSLATFDERQQLDIMDIFCSKNLSFVRNLSAFFIGILKRQRLLRDNHGKINRW